MEVRIEAHNEYFVEAVVKNNSRNLEWRLFGVYLSTNEAIRVGQFQELTSLIQHCDGRVIILGDFNAIRNQGKKDGGNPRSEVSMENFNSFIDDNMLIDLGMLGSPTWTNRRGGNELIRERLDRVMVGMQWREQYGLAVVRRLYENGSDHSPLLLDSNPPTWKSKRRFKFQERWCRNDEQQHKSNSKKEIEELTLKLEAQRTEGTHGVLK
ncbi:uncharacterized protein LOC107606939 [Arachis ipaensis]|uniref:uncharacterized protein LOC107606939 n=1 Tax=Arachis ipaensis TaxID=130454 RepID=UPI0007AF445F|nr:uncharacterized protein LOC107606939 [Arachis ipaensis]XP_025664645.1 uncharacterized protein LOC112763101 [Arachis hypogaea]